MKRTLLIAIAAAALAGCGSSGGNDSTSSGASSSSSSTPTLYTFSKDTMDKSNCSGACAKNWPPATSAPGLDGKITTIKRTDGSSQVALDSHPLYRYVGDKKPGDANGDGLTVYGGLWTKAGGSSAATKPPSRSYGY